MSADLAMNFKIMFDCYSFYIVQKNTEFGIRNVELFLAED